MPELGVYLVKPASRDAIAAALMCSGVSKSGSPAPKLQTSIPSDFIALALLSIESVRDGVRLVALEESCIKCFFQDYMALPVFSTKDFQRVIFAGSFGLALLCKKRHPFAPNARTLNLTLHSFDHIGDRFNLIPHHPRDDDAARRFDCLPEVRCS